MSFFGAVGRVLKAHDERIIREYKERTTIVASIYGADILNMSLDAFLQMQRLHGPSVGGEFRIWVRE